MSDIVERLKDAAALSTGLYAEAADTIAALRAEIEAANEERQSRLQDVGVDCACGYDKPSDVCWVHLPWFRKLRAENARLRGALESFVSADATDAKRMRLAIVDARARLAKGRGLWNGPCHECDEVLRRALTVNNYPAALAEKGE